MKRHREPARTRDPRLDRYRRAAAHLYDGERCVGHLTTRVQVWWTRQGPWWRRRDVGPEERVEWFVEFMPGEVTAHRDGWLDGTTSEVEDLDQDLFQLQGRELVIGWLSGSAAEEHLTARGW